MLTTLVIVIATAALSSLLTLGLGYWLYEIRWRARLEKRIAELAEVLEARVHKGVKEAGIELLPEFQARVEAGFRNALTSMPEKGATAMAKAGASLIEDGLNTLFGRDTPPKRKS